MAGFQVAEVHCLQGKSGKLSDSVERNCCNFRTVCIQAGYTPSTVLTFSHLPVCEIFLSVNVHNNKMKLRIS